MFSPQQSQDSLQALGRHRNKGECLRTRLVWHQGKCSLAATPSSVLLILIIFHHSMHFSFLFIGLGPTTWPASNCLQIMLCSHIIETTLSGEKWHISSLSCQRMIWIWKQTWWSNNKTIIELGYRKISWFVSVSQTNYLPRPSVSASQ